MFFMFIFFLSGGVSCRSCCRGALLGFFVFLIKLCVDESFLICAFTVERERETRT